MNDIECFNCKYSQSTPGKIKATHVISFKYQAGTKKEYGCEAHLIKRAEYIRSLGIVARLEKIQNVELLWH